jgi:hypothetical protein
MNPAVSRKTAIYARMTPSSSDAYAQEDCGNPEDAFARLNASPTPTFPQEGAAEWSNLGYSRAITT